MGYNATNEQCYDCQSDWKSWDGSACTECGGSTPTLDLLLGSCSDIICEAETFLMIDSCAPCTDNQMKWDTATGRCQKCYDLDLKWDPDNNQCIPCPDGFSWQSDFLDKSQGLCVTCATLQKVWSGGQCVTCASLSQIWNSSSSTCYTCESQHKIFSAGNCVECAAVEKVWSSDTSQCVTCEMNQMILAAGVCQTCASQYMEWGTTSCVTCASLSKYWDAGTSMCKECGFQYKVWSGTACVECSTLGQVWGTTSCVTCASQQKIWSTSALACVSCATLSQEWSVSSQSCVTCVSLHKIWDNGACVECTSLEKVWDANTGMCQSCSYFSKTWNPVLLQCDSNQQTQYIISGTISGTIPCETNIDFTIQDTTKTISKTLSVSGCAYQFLWLYSEFATSEDITLTAGPVLGVVSTTISIVATSEITRYENKNLVFTYKTYTISGQLVGGPASCAGIIVKAKKPDSSSLKNQTLTSCAYTISWLYSEYATPALEAEVTITLEVLGYSFSDKTVLVKEDTLAYPDQNITLTSKTYSVTGIVSGLASCTGVGITNSLFQKSATLSGCSFTLSWLYSEFGTPAQATSMQLSATKTGYTSAGVSVSISEAVTSYTGTEISFAINSYTISGAVTGIPGCAQAGSTETINVALGLTISDSSSTLTKQLQLSACSYSLAWTYSEFPVVGALSLTSAMLGFTAPVLQISASELTISYLNQNLVFTVKTYSISGQLVGGPASCAGIIVKAKKPDSSSLKNQILTSCAYSISWLYSEYPTPALEAAVTITLEVLGYSFSDKTVLVKEDTLAYPDQNFTLTSKTYSVTGIVSGLASCTGVGITNSLFQKSATFSGCSFTLSWFYSEFATPAQATSMQLSATKTGFTSAGVSVSISEAVLSYSDKNIAFIAKVYSVSGSITGITNCSSAQISISINVSTVFQAVLTGCTYVISWNYSQYETPTQSATLTISATKRGYISVGVQVSVQESQLTYTNNVIAFISLEYYITISVIDLQNCSDAVITLRSSSQDIVGITSNSTQITGCAIDFTWSARSFIPTIGDVLMMNFKIHSYVNYSINVTVTSDASGLVASTIEITTASLVVEYYMNIQLNYGGKLQFSLLEVTLCPNASLTLTTGSITFFDGFTDFLCDLIVAWPATTYTPQKNDVVQLTSQAPSYKTIQTTITVTQDSNGNLILDPPPITILKKSYLALILSTVLGTTGFLAIIFGSIFTYKKWKTVQKLKQSRLENIKLNTVQEQERIFKSPEKIIQHVQTLESPPQAEPKFKSNVQSLKKIKLANQRPASGLVEE